MISVYQRRNRADIQALFCVKVLYFGKISAIKVLKGNVHRNNEIIRKRFIRMD